MSKCDTCSPTNNIDILKDILSNLSRIFERPKPPFMLKRRPTNLSLGWTSRKKNLLSAHQLWFEVPSRRNFIWSQFEFVHVIYPVKNIFNRLLKKVFFGFFSTQNEHFRAKNTFVLNQKWIRIKFKFGDNPWMSTRLSLNKSKILFR